jgi:hypothetical protein
LEIWLCSAYLAQDPYKGWKVKDIMSRLQERGITFASNTKKADLLALLVKYDTIDVGTHIADDHSHLSAGE